MSNASWIESKYLPATTMTRKQRRRNRMNIFFTLLIIDIKSEWVRFKDRANKDKWDDA